MSSLEVERGLYVLRYGGVPGSDSPVIYVRASPGSEDGITMIAFPGEPSGKLAAPGSLMVIVVEEAATLQITAQARAPGGTLQAEVRLEPLQKDVTVEERAVAPAPLHAGDDLQVLAHVARRGDVTIEDDVWIGGPDAPAPIEGLAMRCAEAVGDLRYQVLAAGDTRWSDWLSAGEFAGSRGKARPLTGVRLRLAPREGANVTLNVEALFLGSTVIRKEGLDVELRSSAGMDPLVGLRIGLKAHQIAPVLKPSVVATGVPTGRVRVFKASAGRRSL